MYVRALFFCLHYRKRGRGGKILLLRCKIQTPRQRICIISTAWVSSKKLLSSLFFAFVIPCFTKIQIENYNSHLVGLLESSYYAVNLDGHRQNSLPEVKFTSVESGELFNLAVDILPIKTDTRHFD